MSKEYPSADEIIEDLTERLNHAKEEIDRLLQNQVIVTIRQEETDNVATMIGRVLQFHLLKPKIYSVKIEQGNSFYEFMSPAFNRVVNGEMDINERITLEPLKMASGEVKFYPDQSSWVKTQKPSPWPSGRGTAEYDAMPPLITQIDIGADLANP